MLAALASTVLAVSSGGDWLLDPSPYEAHVTVSADGREVVMENGLIRRVWRLEPNAACVAFDDLMTGRSLLRAVRPEARVTLDGEELDVGGLVGQPNHAYLTDEWLDAMTTDPAAFVYLNHRIGEPEARLDWPRIRHSAPDAVWPPKGVALELNFMRPGEGVAHGTIVSVNYELYDGLPAMCKWIEIANGQDWVANDLPRRVDRCTVEILAVVEQGNAVELREGVAPKPPDALHVETDYAFGGMTPENANRFTVHWRPDPEFHTQVNYAKQNPCLLEVEPTRGPGAPLSGFESFRVFELVYDSTERERRGLALRRMYRTVAPWVTENPLMLHVVSTDPEVVHTAIDQAAECGFEMLSLSFGSGLNMEDESDANHAKFRALREYAASRDIHLGGYSLLSSRRIQPDSDNCVNPDTGAPGGQTHGFCPALASNWGQEYFRKLSRFFEQTGFLQFTHDGSYPGDFDAAERPPLQRGVDDSQWVQWRIIRDFYQRLLARGVYLRIPDYYYLSGSNECGMGYREVNWSLPRAQQVIHTRQNIYDGTWRKTPSMGWMFVPLTQYHGGGAAATIEPLDEHLDHYERMLAGNLGLGVQAVYRGTRLYDTPRVRAAVKKWVGWYKDYRDILESDLIHGRRADGRDLDWMLHVNPGLEQKGMLVVYNPLDEGRTRALEVDLYYTGLVDTARLRHEGGDPIEVALRRDSSLELEVSVPAGGMTWYVIE
jgi:hypothetical protein